MNFGKKLKMLRTGQKLSQRELAENFGWQINLFYIFKITANKNHRFTPKGISGGNFL